LTPDSLIDNVDRQSPALSRRSRVEKLARCWGIPLFLIALAWGAHYSLSNRLGFYDDDLLLSSPTMNWTWRDLLAYCQWQIVHFPLPQGRPIGFILGSLLPYIGNHIAHVQGMYAMGCAILALNAILLYHLLKRAALPPPMPLLAGIAYILFPADTTRPFLTHQHILEPSITFMLIASNMYLGGGRWRRIFSYAVAVLCLFTYESAILPFLAIPLLESDQKRRWILRWIAHMAVVTVLTMAVFEIRRLCGEPRAIDASTSAAEIISRIVKGSFIGPAIAMYSFWFRFPEGWRDFFREPIFRTMVIAGAVAFAVAIKWVMSDRKPADGDRSTEISGTIKAIGFGIVALMASYLFSFTHYPPQDVEGGGTTVHLAAAIGAAALFAGLANLVVYPLRRCGKGWIGPIVVAIYLGFMLPVMIDEQTGYAIIWQQRQHYFSQVIKLCPDLGEHTTVICQGRMPVTLHYAPVNTWSDYQILQQAYRLPTQNNPPPRLLDFPDIATNQNWDRQVQWRADGKLYFNPPPFGVGVDDALEQGDTILLVANSRGQLQRIDGTIQVAGRPFLLRPYTHPGKVPFPRLPLYRFIMH
jgi:hypothetical protein